MAKPRSFPLLADLCVAAYAPFVGGDHIYVAELRDVARRAADAKLLVAAAGDRVLGTVTFVPDGGPLRQIAGPHEAEFRMLVEPSAHGRGVGTALLRRACSTTARRRQQQGIVCSSLQQMRTAHRIYQRLGFRRAPQRDWSLAPGVELLAFALAF